MCSSQRLWRQYSQQAVRLHGCSCCERPPHPQAAHSQLQTTTSEESSAVVESGATAVVQLRAVQPHYDLHYWTQVAIPSLGTAVGSATPTNFANFESGSGCPNEQKLIGCHGYCRSGKPQTAESHIPQYLQETPRLSHFGDLPCVSSWQSTLAEDMQTQVLGTS